MPAPARPRHDSNEAKIAAIVEAVAHAELTGYPAWGDLDCLSTHTSVDQIEVDPAGIILQGDKFSGILTAFVALRYGSNSDDGFETSDAFEGPFEGHFEKGKPVIDDIKIDTTPFYE